MNEISRAQAFRLFLAVVALIAIASGLSESIYGNFYKEVYNVTAAERGFIEFPRELPGIICVFAIALFSFLGEMRLAIIAQILTIIGLVLLGIFTPSFAVMLVFLFINSMGVHLYMPLNDSIGLRIIGTENTGRRFGVINGVRTAAGFLAGVVVFFGFRSGAFSFEGDVKHIFLIASLFFLAAIFFLMRIRRLLGDPVINTGKSRFLYRKEYNFYYMLASLHGAHKQIGSVFGPWVLIDILLRQADTLALLTMTGSFLGIFFIPLIGRLTDRFGVRRMMFAEGFSFIAVYLLFGVFSAGLMSGSMTSVGLPVFAVYLLFIIDRMTMQLSMVRTLYLHSIALDKAEIAPTLSTGMSIDHVISIVGAFLGGLAWSAWGPQYVFYIAAALSLGNVLIAVRMPRSIPGTHHIS